MTEYAGYSLFTDVEDSDLQARNRATVMWNIYDDNATDGKTNINGFVTVLGYLKNIPEKERVAVFEHFKAMRTPVEKQCVH